MLTRVDLTGDRVGSLCHDLPYLGFERRPLSSTGGSSFSPYLSCSIWYAALVAFDALRYLWDNSDRPPNYDPDLAPRAEAAVPGSHEQPGTGSVRLAGKGDP
jgi:hypothetical protein